MKLTIKSYQECKEARKYKHDEKNQPIKTNQELPEMLELGKGVKVVIITIFWMLKKLSGDMKDTKKKKKKDLNQTSI